MALRSKGFDDPIVKTKPKAGDDPSSGRITRRLGIPVYGILGISLFLFWLIPLMFASPQILSSAYSDNLIFKGRALFVGILCVMGIFAFLTSQALLNKYASITIQIVAALFSPLICIGMLLQLQNDFLLVLWCLSGCGGGLLTLLWLKHLASFKAQRQVMMALLGSFIVGGLLSFFASCFRSTELLAILSLMPLCSVIVHHVASKRTSKNEAYILQNITDRIKRSRFLLKEALPSGSSLMVLGFVSSYLINISELYLGVLSLSLIAAGIITFALLARFSQSPAYSILGLTVPASAILLPVYSASPLIVKLVATGILATLFFVLILVHLSNIARNAKFLFDDHLKALGISLASDSAFFLIGWFTLSLFSLLDLASNVVLLMSTFCVFALQSIVISLCLFTAAPESKHSPLSWLNSENEHQESDSTPRESRTKADRERFLRSLADQYGFSKRETEVFLYLVRGYNAHGVSDALNISINTAKTHMHNIYAKCDVHSRQELIELVSLHAEQQ